MWECAVGGVVVTVSSFGNYLASTRTKGTTRGNVGDVGPSYRASIVPVTSNNRNLLSMLVATAGKGCVALSTRKPLVGVTGARCNLSNGNEATVVRVTTVDKLPLMPVRREGPVLAAAFNAKRLVGSTLGGKYEGFVVNVNKDTAGSTKLKVLRTLNFHFLSGSKRALNAKNRVVRTITGVSASNVRPTLERARFVMTYSMTGPFCNPSKTTCVFTRRGKTSSGVIRELSRNVRSLTRIVGGAAKGSVAGCPNTNTTKNVNNKLLTFFGTRLGPKARLLLGTVSFSRGVGKTSLVVANRKGTSQRATVKGMPCKVLGRTRGRRVPIVMLTNDVRGLPRLGGTKFGNVFSVTPNPVALRGTVRPRFTGRGVAQLISRLCSIVADFNWFTDLYQAGPCRQGKRGY